MDKEEDITTEPVENDLPNPPESPDENSEVQVEKLEGEHEPEYKPEVTFAPKDDGKNILIIVLPIFLSKPSLVVGVRKALASACRSA